MKPLLLFWSISRPVDWHGWALTKNSFWAHTQTSSHKRVIEATQEAKQHICVFTALWPTVVFVSGVPSAAAVSCYSGWLLPKWACGLTASDKLSAQLISVITSLPSSTCVSDPTLHTRLWSLLLRASYWSLRAWSVPYRHDLLDS